MRPVPLGCRPAFRPNRLTCDVAFASRPGRMLKAFSSLLLALAISVATAWINPVTDERAMYGHEGPLEYNWLPREVAGWPAPFLADNPGTSVIHDVGLEDVFRPGPFLATLCFWLLCVLAMRRLGRWAKRKMRRDDRERRQASPAVFLPPAARPSAKDQG